MTYDHRRISPATETAMALLRYSANPQFQQVTGLSPQAYEDIDATINRAIAYRGYDTHLIPASLVGKRIEEFKIIADKHMRALNS